MTNFVSKLMNNWESYYILKEEWGNCDDIQRELDELSNRYSELQSSYNIAIQQKATAEAERDLYKKQAEEAWKPISFWTAKNYNWDWVSYEWSSWYAYYIYPWTSYSDCHIPHLLKSILRFEDSTYYYFWGFMPVEYSTKSSEWSLVVCSFILYKINKVTKVISRWQIGNAPFNYWMSYGKWDKTRYMPDPFLANWMPTWQWEEYTDEFRIYQHTNNRSSSYSSRCWDTAFYFYVKKDWTTGWYVKADDDSNRDSYWVINLSYADAWTYGSRSITELFSTYNTNRIWIHDNNVKYEWNLYTPYVAQHAHWDCTSSVFFMFTITES